MIIFIITGVLVTGALTGIYFWLNSNQPSSELSDSEQRLEYGVAIEGEKREYDKIYMPDVIDWNLTGENQNVLHFASDNIAQVYNVECSAEVKDRVDRMIGKSEYMIEKPL